MGFTTAGQNHGNADDADLADLGGLRHERHVSKRRNSNSRLCFFMWAFDIPKRCWQGCNSKLPQRSKRNLETVGALYGSEPAW